MPSAFSAWFDDESRSCSRCGYFTHETTRDIPKVQCPECGREVLDVTDMLSRISIPPAVLAAIPESIADECCIIPCDNDHARLVVLVDLTQTNDTETFAKLLFVLNRRITCLHADADVIRRAIERNYGSDEFTS